VAISLFIFHTVGISLDIFCLPSSFHLWCRKTKSIMGKNVAT